MFIVGSGRRSSSVQCNKFYDFTRHVRPPQNTRTAARTLHSISSTHSARQSSRTSYVKHVRRSSRAHEHTTRPLPLSSRVRHGPDRRDGRRSTPNTRPLSSPRARHPHPTRCPSAPSLSRRTSHSHSTLGPSALGARQAQFYTRPLASLATSPLPPPTRLAPLVTRLARSQGKLLASAPSPHRRIP